MDITGVISCCVAVGGFLSVIIIAIVRFLSKKIDTKIDITASDLISNGFLGQLKLLKDKIDTKFDIESANALSTSILNDLQTLHEKDKGQHIRIEKTENHITTMRIKMQQIEDFLEVHREKIDGIAEDSQKTTQAITSINLTLVQVAGDISKLAERKNND